MQYRLTPLAAAMAMAFVVPMAVLPTASAQVTEATQSTDQSATLPAVTVKANDESSDTGKTYAGGKVRNGGNVGLLGDQDGKNVPFSVTSYTSKAIQDQQAQTLAQVLANDPAVRTGLGYGTFADSFVIRGFTLSGDAVSYDGLYGILPRQIAATEAFDRVEILKGSSAFLNGVSPDGSGLGGSINAVPKRATDAPISQVTFDYTGSSRLGTHLDLGRRFGPENQIGLRINAVARDGEGSIDNQGNYQRLLSIGTDYRGDKLRLSFDFNYQKESVAQGRSSVLVTSAGGMPAAPSASSNYAQAWNNSLLEDTFGVVRAEYDFSDAVTGYAAVGAHHANEYGVYSNPTVTSSGTGTASSMATSYKTDTLSAETGFRAKFDTGFVKHQANIGFSAYQQSTYSGYSYTLSSFATSLSNPTAVSPLAMGLSDFAGGTSLSDPGITGRVTMHSFAISDTLSVLNDTVLLTVGLRHQDILQKGYSGGIQSSVEDTSANSPAVGIVFKPVQDVSLYANHIEGLSLGSTSGTTYNSLPVSNSSQVFAPFKTKQNEVGVKWDHGTLGASLALFQIKKPTAIYVNNGTSYTYSVNGEQTNRGVEVALYGDPIKGVHLNGGYSFIDAKLSKTQDGTNDGKYATGVAKSQFNLNSEWEVPGVSNAVLMARYIYTAKEYADNANTLVVPSWSRIDLGARYGFKYDTQNVTLRAFIENITNKAYWVASSQYENTLTLGNPRTFKVSATIDF
jgi:iron complex outermembrane receptor protein